MIRTVKILSVLLLLLILVAVAAGMRHWVLSETKHETEVSTGRITGLEPLVRLVSVEIFNEVPVCDTINNKVIFAVQKQRGQISFDIGGLRVDTVGDTLRVDLPREIVELYESTDTDSWRVVDTKNLSIFRSDRLTDGEDNIVKTRLGERAVRRLYADGTVMRARREAAANLRRMMENLYRCPVVVIP